MLSYSSSICFMEILLCYIVLSRIMTSQIHELTEGSAVRNRRPWSIHGFDLSFVICVGSGDK